MNFSVTINERPKQLRLRCDACGGKGYVGVYSHGTTAGNVKIYDTACRKCGGSGTYEPTVKDLQDA